MVCTTPESILATPQEEYDYKVEGTREIMLGTEYLIGRRSRYVVTATESGVRGFWGLDTQLRNRARSARRWGGRDLAVEGLATDARKRFHDTAKRQKKCHWDDFLQNADN